MWLSMTQVGVLVVADTAGYEAADTSTVPARADWASIMSPSGRRSTSLSIEGVA